MIDPTKVPEVSADELLARFILRSSHIRRSNNTIKPDAFIPHPYRELSVTRHLSATEDELWTAGELVAVQTETRLYGRGDFQAGICQLQGLTVVKDPLEENPNHANLTHWPNDKPLQKIIAQEIAAASQFVSRL